jgi:hypothetical protein
MGIYRVGNRVFMKVTFAFFGNGGLPHLAWMPEQHYNGIYQALTASANLSVTA